MASSLQLSCDHDGVTLFGWVAAPSGCRNQNDIQYSYVNGRMMRDKLINHAIRQAYGEFIGQGQYPSYVLYLTVDPRQIDVNVHPAKHEVRFHQARLVHDFIVQALEQALSPATPVLEPVEQNVDVAVAPSIDNSSSYMSGSDMSGQPLRSVQADYVHSTAQQGNNSSVKQSGSKPHHPHYGSPNPSANQLKHYHQAMETFTAPTEVGFNESHNSDEQVAVDNGKIDIEPNELSHGADLGAGVCLSVINGHFAFYQRHNMVFLLDLNKVNGKVAAIQFSQGLLGQPLLLPVKLPMNTSQDKFYLELVECQ